MGDGQSIDTLVPGMADWNAFHSFRRNDSRVKPLSLDVFTLFMAS